MRHKVFFVWNLYSQRMTLRNDLFVLPVIPSFIKYCIDCGLHTLQIVLINDDSVDSFSELCSACVHMKSCLEIVIKSSSPSMDFVVQIWIWSIVFQRDGNSITLKYEPNSSSITWWMCGRFFCLIVHLLWAGCVPVTVWR